MLEVGDISRLGIGRDHNHGHAKPVYVAGSPTTAIVDDGRSNVIVPPSPVIPGEQDRGVRPILAAADGVDDRGYPGWPTAVVAGRVVGIRAIGDPPTHLRQLIVGNIAQNLCIALRL